MRLFRALAMIVAALALLARPALAAEAAGNAARQIQPPLKPGKAAGVHRAQAVRGGLALVGAGGIIALVTLAATTGGGGGDTNQPNMNRQTAPTTTS